MRRACSNATGELLLNTGNFMSMNSRFKDVCDTIIKYRDHKERIIRRTVINLLPRLAAFAPEEFAAKYLDVCMQALLGVLKKDGRGEERASAFLVLGQIAHSVGPGIEPYRPQLTALIKNALDVRNRGYCLQSLTCWSMVSSALGAAVQQDMPEMLGMCVCVRACAVVRVQQREVANRGTEDPSSLRERTCDQLPGAAHKSTARTTSEGGGPDRKARTRQDWMMQRAVGGGCTFENIKIFVDLEQLEGRASPPALLLGFPVVNIL